MKDLTILFYTANSFENKLTRGVRENLLEVAGEYPIISVSQIPMDFGKNICVGEIGKSFRNLYRQILIGAKAATTEYVAMAEDDCLYTKDHFSMHRPKNAFAFNMAKWSIYTWIRPPIFSRRKTLTCFAMIAPRKLLVEALEERYAKYPDDNNYPVSFWAEPGKSEKLMNITVRSTERFATLEQPIVVFYHENALGFPATGGIRKKLGPIQTYEDAYWGKAEDIVNKYIMDPA